MPLYENVFIARQDLSTAQVEAVTESLANIIKDNGGTVAKTEYWGLKGLAYRIKKNRKGHYVLFNLDTPSDALIEMERNMRINEDLLRFLTIRVDEFEEGPSIQMQNRGRDRDRDRDGDTNRRNDRQRDRSRDQGEGQAKQATGGVDKDGAPTAIDASPGAGEAE